jgi:hypothetical protein
MALPVTERHLLGRHSPRATPQPPPPDVSPGGVAEIPNWVHVVAPSTLVPALAFYFGRTNTDAIASYFGVAPGVIDLSAQDYVLRSADVLFIPAGVLLLVALLAAWSHTLLLRHLRDRPDRYTLLIPILVVVGAGLFLLGAVAAWRGLPFSTPFLVPQVSPGLGVGLIAYGVCLRRRRLLETRSKDPASGGHLLSITLVWMVVVLSLFWTTSEWAKALGTGRAEVLAGELVHQPSVVVYSRQRLNIEAPGVLESDIGDPTFAYRYRYSGLRFLLRNGNDYILLPSLWTPQDRVVVVLPQTDSVRLQFRGGAQ